MADPESVDISQGPESLVSIELDQDQWHLFTLFFVVMNDSEHSLGYVVHHQIKIYRLLLSMREECLPQRYYIGMIQLFAQLQFSTLVPLV
jgi:hypothetical protein